MITLVVGGASSGKSAMAERMVAALPGPVTVVVTFPEADADEEMSARIAAHRARRPGEWRTLDGVEDLPAVVASVEGTLLLDALGTWVAMAPKVDGPALCAALRRRSGDAVVVSDEVGMAVHPETAAGRSFRDTLGQLNQLVAAAADEVVLVVAGRAVPTRAVP